ncbi:MAG: hypothetical protein Fur0010_05090 [Bdellovibrio sp.]
MKEFSDKLLSFYIKEYAGINLTRITEPEEFYQKQIYDSTYPFQKIKFLTEESKRFSLMLDVGFGGGFPLIPLAKIFPDKKILGVDARAKKGKAVQGISELAGLSNVKCFHGRIEEVLIDLSCLITFKAVGPIVEFLNKLNIVDGIDVMVVFYKGPNTRELEEVPSNLNNFRLAYSQEFEIFGNGRSIYCYKFNKNVPRGTKKNKNKIVVKISKFA